MTEYTNKKLLGIDGWTGGISHYSRLVKELKKFKIDLKLLHFGSIGHDVNRKSQEIIEGVQVFDIKHYAPYNLEQILLIEKPSAVLFLSTEALLHRAAIRYCQKLKIPTVHLYHGLISVQDTDSGVPDIYSRAAQIEIVIKRIKKNIINIIPIYIKSIIDTKSSISDWSELMSSLYSKFIGKYNTEAPKDATTTCCMVYTDADVNHANRKYHIPINKIHIVGNPDLIKFKIRSQDILSCFKSKDRKTIIFIDHGGSTSALNYNSVEEFIGFLTYTRSKLADIGYDFEVKLHPSQYWTNTPIKLHQLGFKLTSDQDFIRKLKESAAVLSGPSSAALVPAILGLPLFLVQYNEFKGQKYGKILTTYPGAILLKNLDEITDFLASNKEKSDKENYETWIKNNIGPLPASAMPFRVAEIINQIVTES